MPRTVQLTVPPARCEDLVEDLRGIDLLALRVQHGVSVQPPGDVVTIDVANGDLRRVMRVADEYGLGEEGGVSMSTAVPLSIISTNHQAHTREPGATTWEELEIQMGADSTMTAERVAVMGIAGFIAGVGILSDAIHIVVGAMVIAPGFQPFARFVLGVVNRSSASWRGGLLDIARAYAALVTGAAVAGVLGRVLDVSAVGSALPSYLASGTLLRHWTTLTWHGVVVGAVAGVCGGLLMSINRTVLTAGVMVALALVPTASLVTMSLVDGDLASSGAALVRFSVEVALVLLGNALVFGGKRVLDRRRKVR